MSYKEILPNGKVLQQNSTHIAVQIEKSINVYSKGFIIDENTVDEYKILPELLYAMDMSEEDNLFAIFQDFDEQNRINLAEANGQL